MFDHIYRTPLPSSQATHSICDGPDVRYTTMFVAADDGSSCGVICSVWHAGVPDVVAHSSALYGDKITTF